MPKNQAKKEGNGGQNHIYFGSIKMTKGLPRMSLALRPRVETVTFDKQTSEAKSSDYRSTLRLY